MRRILLSCGLAAAFLLSMSAVALAGHIPPDSCKAGTGFFFSTDCNLDSIPQMTFTLVPGQTANIFGDPSIGAVCTVGPANVSGITDTVCVEFVSARGWTYTSAWDACFALDSGFFSPDVVTASIPCGAVPGDADTVLAIQRWCADDTCQTGCPGLDTLTFYVDVVAAPPAIAVVCTDTSFAEAGVSVVTLPFDICNPDPCADTLCYNYSFTASSHVSGLTASGSGSVNVAPGDCQRVNVTLDASLAVDGDTSLVTMLAETPCVGAVAFDTCVTFLIIVPPATNVPLFSTPMAAILILSLVLMAAGIMRRRALVS